MANGLGEGTLNSNMLNSTQNLTVSHPACAEGLINTYFLLHFITYTHIIYIYIYILFGPVKSELGVIPSGQENDSRAEHLNLLYKHNT